MQGCGFDVVLEVLVDFYLLICSAPHPFFRLSLGEHALVKKEQSIPVRFITHKCVFQLTELILLFLLGPTYFSLEVPDLLEADLMLLVEPVNHGRCYADFKLLLSSSSSFLDRHLRPLNQSALTDQKVNLLLVQLLLSFGYSELLYFPNLVFSFLVGDFNHSSNFG